MIAILKAGVPQEQIDNLIRWLEHQGLQIHISAGEYYTVLGLEMLSEAKKETGLPICTEVMNVNQLELFGDVARRVNQVLEVVRA